jgi:ribonucleoside-diphosphate reductase alpha chain
MLEQEDSPAKDVTTAPLYNMTQLEGIRQKVFMDRYSLKDADGKPLEFYPEQLWARVARGIAAAEQTEEKRDKWERLFYDALTDFKFVPGGRILAGAGTEHQVTYYNCFVIPSPEDSRQGILDNLKVMTEIMARGGGVGINLSTLRPRGSYIRTVNGTASGPCSWAQLYSVATGDVIQQGGSRRGALMLMLDDTHPDIEEFITVKKQKGMIEHANLSVCISDAFMDAVKNNANWDLIWQGQVKKTIRARHLWDLICTSAWESAEPGVVFMDRCNKEANTWYYESIRCVNPCITGDTFIYTDRGLYSAKELADIGLPVTVASPDITIGDLVPSRHAFRRMKTQTTKKSPSGDVSLRQASHVFPTGFKSVYRLQTKEGYTLRLTKNHKVLTLEGWKEAGNLVHGEKIHLLHGESGFGSIGNEDLGKIHGWLVGDGYINTDGRGSVCLCFWGTERVLAHDFAKAIDTLVSHPSVNQRSRTYHVGIVDIADRNECRVESTRMLQLIDKALLSEKLQVPPSVLRGSRDMQKGFLSALFTADGCALGEQEKGVSIRLTSASQTLLENVQRLLLNFGIGSQIYKNRRSAGERLLPDSKGGYAPYQCKAYHEVVISGSNLALFTQKIGFLVEEKQGKMENALANYKRALNQDEFLATFESLIPDGEEIVYDITEPEKHLFVANGLVIHNCGEQPLPFWGVCNLGALNLSSFVKDGSMDWEQLAKVSKIAMRFLDNVIDATEYFIADNQEAQLGTRRTGLGTMGLADALIKMKVPYGSEGSLPIIEHIYATIRDAAYEASADIATEKGPFTQFDRDKYMQGKFVKRLPEPIQDKIKKQGIRNAVLLTQAPTGTTSLLAGVSSGIEPVYDFAMIRRDRTGEHILYHPLLQAWRDGHPDDPTPNYFVSSKDLTPEEHVRAQAMVQRYTDASISKTVNAPNDHTVEQVQKLYRLAYEMGCKGVTYYRDGSRDAVLTRVEDEKKAAATQTPSIDTVTSIYQGIKQRPAVVQGYTRQVNAPEGKVNVTINSDEQGPFEVFVNVGKAGSDIAALSEALGRLISLNLQILSPLSPMDRAQEICKQLRSIGGSRSVGFGVQQVRSLPDAVARALELHIEAVQTAGNQETAHDEGDQTNNHNQQIPTSARHPLKVTGNLCSQCGCNTMVYEEGCKKCYSCGYSEC